MATASNTDSVDTKVFDSQGQAWEFGRGGIWYEWKDGEPGRFPQDVRAVGIVMPFCWPESTDPVPVTWNVVQGSKTFWTLSGTREAPQLRASLLCKNTEGGPDWWHGFLDTGNPGRLRSC